MDTPNIILPAPTLIIALGPKCGNIASQSQAILCRAEPRRVAIMELLVLESATDDENVKLVNKLEDIIHNLRLHEKLIEVGLGEESDLPLNIILLADLTDESSLRLYAVLDALDEILIHEANSDAYLLLKTAVFDGSVDDNVPWARLHMHLQKLQNRAQHPGWAFQTYLFDRYKEGVWEVKNDDELSLLMGNFVMALLSGRFAQQINSGAYAIEAQEEKAHFNSAGATALLYDPLTLQNLCALRLGREFLETQFLGDSFNPQDAEDIFSLLSKSLGTLYEWEEALCMDVPCKPERNEGISLDLTLADLSFENLPFQEWQEEITGYADFFERELLPHALETMQKNSTAFSKNTTQKFLGYLNDLPILEALYPGMLHAYSWIIQETAKTLNRCMQECFLSESEEQIVNFLASEYEEALEDLEAAENHMPALPRWITYLPGPISPLAKALFNVLFLHKEHHSLLVLRERAIKTMKRKLAFPLEQETRKLLIDLSRQCLKVLEETDESVKCMRAAFQATLDEMTRKQQLISGGGSPFRVEIMDQALAEWAYVTAKPSLADILLKLLDKKLLEDWRQIKSEKLYVLLYELCRAPFQNLLGMDVEESLLHWSGEAKETIAMRLAQGCVPLLRPNFDLVGDGPSFQLFYYLCDEPRFSDFLHSLDNAVREWQLVPTGDPYLLMFCRIRQLISIQSLDFLKQRAARGFEKLGKQEQKTLRDSFEITADKEKI